MIDWIRVRELRAEIGDAGFSEVVEIFLEEVEAVLFRLDPAAGAARLHEDMHFLKGCAWNLGFSEFGAQCHSSGRRALAGNCDPEAITRLLACYNQSRQEFLAGLDEGAANAA